MDLKKDRKKNLKNNNKKYELNFKIQWVRTK